jgi:hypothetical protein
MKILSSLVEYPDMTPFWRKYSFCNAQARRTTIYSLMENTEACIHMAISCWSQYLRSELFTLTSGSISQLLCPCSVPWLPWMELNLWRNFARHIFFFIILVGWGETVHLACRPLILLFYQPRMIDECGAFDGMRTVRGNQSTWRKPAPVQHDWTQAITLGTRWLTAWAIARCSSS